MITVRALITEALSRSNLVSRRQSASADMVESAFRLLKGIASKYSNDNLLTFLTAQATHVLDKREFVIGEFEDVPLEYLTLDIDCPRIQKVNKVYWRSIDQTGLGNYVELKYASPDDFDSYPDGCAVYTVRFFRKHIFNGRHIYVFQRSMPFVGLFVRSRFKHIKICDVSALRVFRLGKL